MFLFFNFTIVHGYLLSNCSKDGGKYSYSYSYNKTLACC